MINKLAINGGGPIRKTFLPFALPSIGKEEIREVTATLKSGWLTTGPRTEVFEKSFRMYTGAPCTVAVNSCTAALHLSLLGFNIGPEDEVITTPLTFAATANAILMSGAKPVFADIQEDTYNIDPKAIERCISKKTKAIIPVHLGGLPADMDAILRLADKYNLNVIEDAAHALGARYGDLKVGNISNATCFSFYPTKTITTGEGGMIAAKDEKFSDRVRMLSLHGLSKDAWNRYSKEGAWYYEIIDLGYKYNMSDIQAALGIHQLKKIDRLIRRRREIAQMYNKAFRKLEEIILPPTDNDKSEHVYHLYTVRLSLNRLAITRDRFVKALRAENIGSSVHFIPIHLHPYYRKRFGFKEGDFPMAESVFNNIVSFPIYPKMTDKDVKDVITAVEKIIKAAKK